MFVADHHTREQLQVLADAIARKRTWKRFQAVLLAKRGWTAPLIALAPENRAEIGALEADRGRYPGYVRLVGRRRAGTELEAPVVSLTEHYKRARLPRGEER